MNADLQRDGYTILPSVIPAGDCAAISRQLMSAMQQRDGDAIKAGKGRVVGGRNLLTVWDGWRPIVSQPTVKNLIANQLGESAGLVRILYFDKPPGKGWALSLHKDQTIAVKEHIDPPTPFSKPTRKAGVPHVEATRDQLQRMLTLRLNLDPMHDDNGPLIVVPESHRKESDCEIKTIHCNAGDMFAMKPLLSHGSLAAAPNTADHRRVVHLELAPKKRLPGSYQWHDFMPL